MLIRILIIDDEIPMVEILSRFLEPISSFIDYATGLHDGLEKARTGNFNVVLLDLRLGVTGKEEALVAIRGFKQFGASVVVVSGINDPHLKEDCLAAGASSFVSKDVGFNSQALLLATNIATLKLPKESYRSDSFLQHVEMLREMVEHPA